MKKILSLLVLTMLSTPVFAQAKKGCEVVNENRENMSLTIKCDAGDKYIYLDAKILFVEDKKDGNK